MKTVSKLLFLLVVCSWILFSIIFFIGQLREAYLFPMWLDENYGLEYNIRQFSYSDILIHGAAGQGSPCPLDYLALKFLDKGKEKFNYFSFPPHVYFRLFSNLATSFIPLIILFFVLKKIRSGNDVRIRCAQLFLTLSVPICYYFTFHVYKYAHEARPYAIWNSLYFLSLALFLTVQNTKWLVVPLALLAFSATASIFQIGSLLVIFLITHLFNQVSIKKILREASSIFLFPLLIGFYYSPRAMSWSYDSGSWAEFFNMWSHECVPMALLAGLGFFCLIRSENRSLAIAPFSFVLLYLMGPAIFWITKWKGFFYADRQYLYYDLARSVILLTVIVSLPVLPKSLSSQKKVVAALVGICLLFSVFALRPKLLQRFQNTFQMARDVLTVGFEHAPLQSSL